MPKYIVKEPLRHNGEQYAPGDTVEMTAKQAKELISIDVLAAGSEEEEQGLNAKEAIARAMAAKNKEELDSLANGETRKSVLAAIDARRKEVAA